MDYSEKEVNGSADAHYSLVVEFKVLSFEISTFILVFLAFLKKKVDYVQCALLVC